MQYCFFKYGTLMSNKKNLMIFLLLLRPVISLILYVAPKNIISQLYKWMYFLTHLAPSIYGNYTLSPWPEFTAVCLVIYFIYSPFSFYYVAISIKKANKIVAPDYKVMIISAPMIIIGVFFYLISPLWKAIRVDLHSCICLQQRLLLCTWYLYLLFFYLLSVRWHFLLIILFAY